MSENTIFVKKYEPDEERFPINEKEIWRYSGYMGLTQDMDDTLKNLLDEVKKELQGVFSYKVCYRRVDITWDGDMPVLPFPSESKHLAKCLEGSKEVILFAATIGLEIDRKIAKYKHLSQTKALLMQAYGAERVECLCNSFCKEMEEELAKEGLCTTTRFSPGYGDLPLEKQVDFFQLLDCNRQIGISLGESLLMTPSKSVTAIFGIGNQVEKDREHKCELCNNTTCEYRKQNQ